MSTLYLDNNATTRPAKEVIEAMRPLYDTHWGNPSSLHHFGRSVTEHLDHARRSVAGLLGAQRSSEVIFTSGGTEGNNLAIHSLCQAQPNKRHIITTQVEHPSVLAYCHALERAGYRITYLGVDRDGQLDPQAVTNAITEETALAAIMWANNETGIIFPMADIAQRCVDANIPCHCDAVQAAGKISLDLSRIPITTLAISGHKLHAPKGIGALYLRRGTAAHPLLWGGGHEFGRRAGTENAPHIVGLGMAATLARERLTHDTPRIRAMRDRLETGLLAAIPGSTVHGMHTARVPNTTNISFPGLDGEGLLISLSDADVAVSTGSACAAGATEPSPVLRAMHVAPDAIRGSLRLSLSRETTEAEIDRVLEIFPKVVARQAALRPGPRATASTR